MKRICIVLITMASIISYAYAGGAIKQIGYFKDKGKNRIFTLSFPKGMSKSDIKSHAMGLRNTDRRITAGYYYEEGAVIPADGITMAKSIPHANHILYDITGLSSWSYAYMKSFNGSIQFVNCIKTPDNDLCRQ